MKNVRVWFEKKGAVRYISHLDLTRNMSRGIKLSGLPVWYTEGFNPRIYMTYAMPLSLGVCGERECMDIRLTEEFPLEEIAPRLNAHLPADLRALEATEPVDKFEEIQFGDYEVFLESQAPDVLQAKLDALLGREAILTAAREEGLPCSQQEVRRILAALDRAGLARVSRGRGGTRLTPAGRALCRQAAEQKGVAEK